MLHEEADGAPGPSCPAKWFAVSFAPCRWPGSLSKESCLQEANPTKKT